MNYLADLHIHSPFSRATSPLSNLVGLHAWAQVKGINVIGTGDFTHPGWFSQLQDKLVEAEDGFYRLADDNVPLAMEGVQPEPVPVRFCLTAEISSIYKRHDKVRKVHNIIFAPDLASVQRFNSRLAAIGNIESDGRPILGLDSHDLLEIVLEEIPGGFLVPAHIWTPWFSLFGSKSGFDDIEDCYGDLTKHIFALETGLSSDPEMNRLISALDRFTLISNSDCHSPSKLGREVNIFDCDLSFYAMREAIKNPQNGMVGTVEFYPEEGKYHYDGHRKCGICFDPLTTREHDTICPVCAKPLTVGVTHRIMELADRDHPHYPEHSPDFESLVPLAEIISELTGVGPASKTVLKQYAALINRFGSEFAILRTTPLEDLDQFSGVLAEAIRRVREKKVIRQAGFDGQFGVIHVFKDGEIDTVIGQQDLFQSSRKKKRKKISKVLPTLFSPLHPQDNTVSQAPLVLNKGQQQALTTKNQHIIVAAGPGTGKTYVLVKRIKKLIDDGVAASKIAAITFTIKAAEEIHDRLHTKNKEKTPEIFTGTFHAFCLHWLRQVQPALTVIGDETRQLLIKQLFPALPNKDRQQIRAEIISHFYFLATRERVQAPGSTVKSYLQHLEMLVAIDLDAIIPTFLVSLTDQHFRQRVASSLQVLLIDEFQDVNQSQYDLVCNLAQDVQVFAIGDPDQAIYGFRGSDLSFFFRFGKDMAAKTILLEQNYRSGHVIVEAASTLIQHNQQRSGLCLQSEGEKPSSIHYEQLAQGRSEADYIVSQIDKLIGGTSSLTAADGHYGFSDIAILMRMKRQSVALTEALHRKAIPFQQVGTTPFFMSKGCRPLSLCILCAAGKCDLGDYLELFHGLTGIGEQTIALMEQHLPLDSKLIWPSLFNLELTTKVRSQLERLVDLLSELGEKSDIQPYLHRACTLFKLDEDQEEVQRLLELSAALGSLESVAEHLSRGREAVIYDERAEAVSLMTLHGSKGLEFPVVFICGLEEGITPYSRAGGDMEEERRLFYVGLTRAKEQLYLTRAKNRHGKETLESRFIKELPAHLLSTTSRKTQKKKKKNPTAKQLKLF